MSRLNYQKARKADRVRESAYSDYVLSHRRRQRRKAKSLRAWRSKRRYAQPPAEDTIPPFKPRVSPVSYKLLRVQGNSITSDSLWKRQHGLWRCVQAHEPFDWFTRINHPGLVRDWLIKNYYEFHWLSIEGQPRHKSACTAPKPQAELRPDDLKHDDATTSLNPKTCTAT
jgi:hypothetical protein